MNNLNSILLEGNLTADPVAKTLESGTNVTTFSVATTRLFKNGDRLESETSYFDVETWGKMAVSCAEILSKGRGVRVVGRLKQDRWVNDEGKNRSKVKIVAEHVEFKPVSRQQVVAAEQADEPVEQSTTV